MLQTPCITSVFSNHLFKVKIRDHLQVLDFLAALFNASFWLELDIRLMSSVLR